MFHGRSYTKCKYLILVYLPAKSVFFGYIATKENNNLERVLVTGTIDILGPKGRRWIYQIQIASEHCFAFGQREEQAASKCPTEEARHS